MFHLFEKKSDQSPLERLAACTQKRDWAGLARAYYDLGVAAMGQGDQERAVLWLSRADTIYSAQDDIYEAVGEKLTDDCSARLGALEEEPLLYNDIPSQVEGLAAALGDVPVRVWGLFSLARLATLGQRLSSLPGCEALGKLGWAVDMVLKSFQTPLTQAEFNGLRELAGALYDLGDDPAFWGLGSQIELPGAAPFQVFDLNGMAGVHLEAEAYLSNHLELLCTPAGEEPPSPETGLIGAALLPDYYLRTQEGPLEEIPQIKAELERIMQDYQFIRSQRSWETVLQQAARYKQLDILALPGAAE